MKTATWIALAFWLVIGASMVIDFRYQPGGSEGMAALLAVVSMLLMFGWYIADSNEHGIERRMWFNVLVILLGVIALPYYRFRHFGARKGAVFLGWVLAAFVGTAILATLLIGLLFGLPQA
ncbi:MAG: hypothetical protein AAF660_15260 [Pseudomonadota bacterium]